jgi:hypothetical protein
LHYLSPAGRPDIRDWLSSANFSLSARDAPARKPKAREPSLMLFFHPKKTFSSSSDEQVFFLFFVYSIFLVFLALCAPVLRAQNEEKYFLAEDFCQKFSASRLLNSFNSFHS